MISKRTIQMGSGYLMVAIVSVFVIALLPFRSGAAETKRPLESGEHVITLHDGGSEKGFYTKAATLGAALADADVRLDPNDRTEPALDEPLLASSYTVNIYRARPIIIRDGSVETRVISAYRTASQIAEHAGIILQAEDKAELMPSKDIVTDGAAEILVLDRATPVTMDFYGKTLQAYTHDDTVGGMLKTRAITLGSSDKIEPGLNTTITPDMKIRIWREGKQTITQDEDVDFDVEQIKDANQETGYKEVKTPGVKGRKTVTYEVVIQNGAEVSRKAINETVTTQPTRQVEIVGAKSRFAKYTGGGSMTEWLQAAGVPESDWGYAQSIIAKESGWNPNATNPSSGACGLAQALPCSKVPGNPYDPVDNLRWANGYAVGRYGSWAAAYNFWQAKHWW